MDSGTGVLEVVGIHFSQQHLAFNSLGLGRVRSRRFRWSRRVGTEARRRPSRAYRTHRMAGLAASN